MLKAWKPNRGDVLSFAVLLASVGVLVAELSALHAYVPSTPSVSTDPCAAERLIVDIATADVVAAEQALLDAQSDLSNCFANTGGPCLAEKAIVDIAEADVSAAEQALLEAETDLAACEGGPPV